MSDFKTEQIKQIRDRLKSVLGGKLAFSRAVEFRIAESGKDCSIANEEE